MATNPDKTAFQIRIPKKLHSQLVDAANERDLPLNWIITKALEDFVSRLIPVSEFKLTKD